MTHALTLTLQGRPARLSFTDEVWTQIAAAYLAGATAAELAARWGVSRTSIYRHTRRLGCAKRGRGASEFAAANAEKVLAAEEERRAARFKAGDLHDLATEAPHDPAVLAQIATTAAGNAMLAGRFDEGRALTDLARRFTQLAREREPTLRELIVSRLFDREMTDHMYAYSTNGPMETKVKHLYWKLRWEELEQEKARVGEMQGLRERVRELEGAT